MSPPHKDSVCPPHKDFCPPHKDFCPPHKDFCPPHKDSVRRTRTQTPSGAGFGVRRARTLSGPPGLQASDPQGIARNSVRIARKLFRGGKALGIRSDKELGLRIGKELGIHSGRGSVCIRRGNTIFCKCLHETKCPVHKNFV